jgi:hypothetical protein
MVPVLDDTTSDGSRPWVHVVCGLFTPEVTMREEDLRPETLAAVDPERRDLQCALCRGPGGVQCCVGECFQAVHPFCALGGGTDARGDRYFLDTHPPPDVRRRVGDFAVWCRLHSRGRIEALGRRRHVLGCVAANDVMEEDIEEDEDEDGEPPWDRPPTNPEPTGDLSSSSDTPVGKRRRLVKGGRDRAKAKRDDKGKGKRVWRRPGPRLSRKAVKRNYWEVEADRVGREEAFGPDEYEDDSKYDTSDPDELGSLNEFIVSATSSDDDREDEEGHMHHRRVDQQRADSPFMPMMLGESRKRPSLEGFMTAG